MTTPFPLSIRRLIIVAFCVTIAVIGLTIFLIPFSDSDTTFTSVCTIAVMVVLWPICVGELIYGGGPPVSAAIFWIGCIATGLFWACIVELVFKVKRRLWPNKPLEPTATAPSVVAKI